MANETCTEEMTSASGHAESDNDPFSERTQCLVQKTAWRDASGGNAAEHVGMLLGPK